MVYVCEDCEGRLRNYGWGCSQVFDSICAISDVAPLVVIEDSLVHRGKSINVILRFLEEKGYLYSTEISQHGLAYSINASQALYSVERDELCWCRYIDHLH